MELSMYKEIREYLKKNVSKDTLVIDGRRTTMEGVANAIEEKNKENNSKNILVIIDNKTYEDIDLLKKYSNVSFFYDMNHPLSICSIDEFKSMRDRIDSYKSLVLEKNLSPLEQITLIYDMVKSYRYKKGDMFNSRTIHSIFSTRDIVCVGYVLLMQQILTELGYECYKIALNTKIEKHGHVQFMIKVKDEKYGIDGYYVFDPTADSAKKIVYCIDKDGDERIKNESEIEKEDKILYDFGENALYRAFLIPLKQYKSFFNGYNSIDIRDMNQNEVTENFISDIRESENYKGLDLNLFFNLMYKVRRAQGYSSEDSIKSACDLVSVNFVYPDDQDSINEIISNIDDSFCAERIVYTKK